MSPAPTTSGYKWGLVLIIALLGLVLLVALLVLAACTRDNQAAEEQQREIAGLKTAVKALQEKTARMEAAHQALEHRVALLEGANQEILKHLLNPQAVPVPPALAPPAGGPPAAAPLPAAPPAPPGPLTIGQLLKEKDRLQGTRVTVKGMPGTVLVHHKTLLLKSPEGMVEVYYGDLPDAKTINRLSSTNLDQPLTVTGIVAFPARTGGNPRITAEAVEF